MKHSFLSVLLVLISYCSFGQYNTFFPFIEDAIKSRNRNSISKIVYLDSSILYYQAFHHFIDKGNAIGRKGQSKVKMRFKKEEINLIDKGFKNAKRIKWEDSLFTNSVRITPDTLLLLRKNIDTYKYFQKHFANKYYYISQPIFARNGTVAIFRLEEMYSPSAGYDLLYIYVKQQEKWEQKMLIHVGAW
jgi:hypothetical protein